MDKIEIEKLAAEYWEMVDEEVLSREIVHRGVTLKITVGWDGFNDKDNSYKDPYIVFVDISTDDEFLKWLINGNDFRNHDDFYHKKAPKLKLPEIDELIKDAKNKIQDFVKRVGSDEVIDEMLSGEY